MAVFGRKGTREEATPARAVLAAAMPLSGPGVRRVATMRRSQTVEAWQNDAWYYYDAVGELRAPINWISNAVSAANPFAAETDPETGLVTGPTDNETVQAVAAQLLGGPSKRAQQQYVLAVCWQIPGEAFVVIRPTPNVKGQPQPDQWLILAGDRVQQKGGSWQYTDPSTLDIVKVGTNDRLIRVWSPHPRDQAMADTAVRPALPILREIEKSSQNIAARLDSRLAGNGILPIPQEMNFPSEGFTNQGEAFGTFLMEAMGASLSNPGTASAQAPIVVEMPFEMITALKDGFLDLGTAFDASVVDLRDNSLERLAATLDMPKEVARGTTGEANHWSAWQVEESTYKIYIEPLLQRLGDALTEYWFRPALEAMGVTDSGRYVIDWDTSEIINRPDQSETLKSLYDLDLISDEYMRSQNGIPDDAIPTADELTTRRAWQVVQADPTYASQRDYAEVLGLPEPEIRLDATRTDVGAGVDVNATPEDAQRALPARGTAAPEPDAVPDGLAAAATFVVFDALSRAGGRLLTAPVRGQFKSTPKQDLYLSIDYAPGDIPRLLEGSFQNVTGLAQAFGYDPSAFAVLLRSYVDDRLRHKVPHDPATLRRFLR